MDSPHLKEEILFYFFTQYEKRKKSRFHRLFRKITNEEKNNNIINLDNILSGIDDRTSIIIKYIRPTISINMMKFIISLFGEYNFLYLQKLPRDLNRTICYINFKNYKDIVKLYLNINKLFYKLHLRVYYSKQQGADELFSWFYGN